MPYGEKSCVTTKASFGHSTGSEFIVKGVKFEEKKASLNTDTQKTRLYIDQSMWPEAVGA